MINTKKVASGHIILRTLKTKGKILAIAREKTHHLQRSSNETDSQLLRRNDGSAEAMQ